MRGFFLIFVVVFSQHFIPRLGKGTIDQLELNLPEAKEKSNLQTPTQVPTEPESNDLWLLFKNQIL